MTLPRREFCRTMLRAGMIAGPAAVFALAGCGRGVPSAGFGDVVELTEEALRDLLLGLPPERTATLAARPDPPLLKQGVYETVLLAADAEGFVRVSGGSVAAAAIRDVEKRVGERLDRQLKRRGFRASVVPFGPEAAQGSAEKALLATLTPATQETGSPRERAEGKGKTLVFVRLTITDPRTGTILSRRDYYSGRDVRTPR